MNDAKATKEFIARGIRVIAQGLEKSNGGSNELTLAIGQLEVVKFMVSELLLNTLKENEKGRNE